MATKAKPTSDEQTLALIKLVKQQKAEIAAAERSNWVTNCTFTYVEGSANTINLHTEQSVRNLVMIVAFLTEREKSYNDAITLLGCYADPFKWCGFTPADWIEDVRHRISKIQIASKRKKLETLETRLNAIISPELRAQMELEDIANELG